MKLRNYHISLVLLTLTSLGWGQSPPCAHNWCGPYTAHDSNCRSGPATGTGSCTGMSGGYNIGWYAQTGATGQPGSISASYIDDWGLGTAGPDVVPNAAVGSHQYVEFANRYIQAFDKTTREPIFVTSPSVQNFYPQTSNGAWGTNQACGDENNDWNISYDHINGVWVLVGMAKVINPQNNNITKGVLCIAVSTTDQLLQSDSHCGFSTGYCNFWSTYGFDITALLPSIQNGGVNYYDLPDYARFGTWVDGNYYVDFDLLDYENNGNNGIIHGFAACQISGSAIRAGLEYNGGTTDPLTCYQRLNSNWSSGGFAQIHTLLPADVQNNAIPPSTNGEYFLATVSPFVSGVPCVPSATQPCTSNRLAFWTWSSIQSESVPAYVTTNSSFIPGCYYTGSGGRPYGDTACIPQPNTTNEVDSVGDRLMSPLAYRYLSPCVDGLALSSCEYLAVTQTIQEDQAWDSGTNFYADRATGVRYYTLIAPSVSSAVPTIAYEGDFYDTNGSLYYWMPSNAIDKNQVVGYTFTIGDGVSNYPSIYADTVDASGNTPTSPSLVQAGSAAITDPANHSWGEYVSMSVNPNDDLTFWGVGEYLTTTESNCHVGGGTSNRCQWLTRIFTCKKGSGVCP